MTRPEQVEPLLFPAVSAGGVSDGFVPAGKVGGRVRALQEKLSYQDLTPTSDPNICADGTKPNDISRAAPGAASCCWELGLRPDALSGE